MAEPGFTPRPHEPGWLRVNNQSTRHLGSSSDLATFSCRKHSCVSLPSHLASLNINCLWTLTCLSIKWGHWCVLSVAGKIKRAYKTGGESGTRSLICRPGLSPHPWSLGSIVLRQGREGVVTVVINIKVSEEVSVKMPSVGGEKSSVVCLKHRCDHLRGWRSQQWPWTGGCLTSICAEELTRNLGGEGKRLKVFNPGEQHFILHMDEV